MLHGRFWNSLLVCSVDGQEQPTRDHNKYMDCKLYVIGSSGQWSFLEYGKDAVVIWSTGLFR